MRTGYALIGFTLAIAGAHGPAAPQASSPQAKRALSAASGHLLQGDAPAALRSLRAVPEGGFAGGDAALRSCMLRRFADHADGSLPADLPAFSARVLGVYRAYWREALGRPGARAAAEVRLASNLRRLLGASTSEWSELEAQLRARLVADGSQPLMGRTPPLLELMLWRRQGTEARTVPLPEGPQAVTLFILDDFASLGWSNYATCGRSTSGGWVRPEGVYAVRPGWRGLDDESFAVSFLGHEAQHFADNARFPGLKSWELEYRAKLAELALARTTHARLLESWSTGAGSDADIPHAYANGRVLDALRTTSGASADPARLPAAALRDLATRLLHEDSRRRRGED